MASIKKREDGKYRARYRDEAGKEHARHFARRVDAQQWLDEVTASVVRGDYVDPKAGRITVADYATKWEAVQVSSDGTKRVVDNAVRVHLVPRLGKQTMASARWSTVQGFIRQLEADGLSPRTVKVVFAVVSAMFKAAEKDRIITRSPCADVTLPKVHDDEVVPPTVEEVASMSAAIEERYRALVVTLAGSGLRIGEALGLNVSDVNFLQRTIRVDKQRRQDGTIGPVKSASSRRTVPVGRVVIDELAAHLAAHPTHGPIFLDSLGQPLRYRIWRGIWERTARPLGIAHTSHDLRHFYASALIAGGASVKQVQTVLGHADASITLKTYAHLWPGDDDRTRQVMDAALGPLADSLRTGAAVNT
jgi:integrase